MRCLHECCTCFRSSEPLTLLPFVMPSLEILTHVPDGLREYALRTVERKVSFGNPAYEIRLNVSCTMYDPKPEHVTCELALERSGQRQPFYASIVDFQGSMLGGKDLVRFDVLNLVADPHHYRLTARVQIPVDLEEIQRLEAATGGPLFTRFIFNIVPDDPGNYAFTFQSADLPPSDKLHLIRRAELLEWTPPSAVPKKSEEVKVKNVKKPKHSANVLNQINQSIKLSGINRGKQRECTSRAVPKKPVVKKPKHSANVNFLSAFQSEPFEQDEHTNFTVSSGEVTFHVHRGILLARSDVVKRMLSADMAEKREQKLVLDAFDPGVVKKFLTRIYDLNYAIESANIDELASLTQLFHMHEMMDVVEECGELLAQMLSKDRAHVFVVLKVAHLCGLEEVFAEAVKQLRVASPDLWNNPELVSLGAEVLAAALRISSIKP